MKYIIDYIIAIGNLLVDLFKFVFDFLFTLIQILVSCVVFLGKIIGALPTFITVAALALIVVSVLYKVLGRESQS